MKTFSGDIYYDNSNKIKTEKQKLIFICTIITREYKCQNQHRKVRNFCQPELKYKILITKGKEAENMIENKFRHRCHVPLCIPFP